MGPRGEEMGMRKRERSDRDMTRGVVWQQLALFALPILLGELFQQLYNTVDSAIVGRFVGTEALAAVGSTGNLTKMLIGFFIGISIGCTVVIGRHYGAHDEKGLRDGINVIMFLSLAIGIGLSVIGVLITVPVLRVMNTPEDVFPLARTYVQIYFGGMLGFVLYNTSTGILRAVGDSRHPLMFLIFSSILNVILDCLFVIVFHLGVAGVAIATILSQFISAGLCILLLLRTREIFRWEVSLAFWRPDLIKDIMKVGLPTAVQRALTQVSNIIVISFIAVFGSACMAGWAIYIKLNSFMLITSQSIASSATTFMSQNAGAGNVQRIRAGIRSSMIFAQIMNLFFMVLFLVAAEPMSRIFGDDPAMIAYAVRFLHALLPFSVLQCFQTVYGGCLRGLGRAMLSTVILLTGLIGFRQLYLFVVMHFINTPEAAGLSYPAGWLCSCVLFVIVHIRESGRNFGIISENG